MQFRKNPIMSLLGVIAAWYFLVISGNLSIELSPIVIEIPITLQSLAVLIIGGLLGPYLSSAAVLAYLFTGAYGFTTFANGAYGYAVLAGKTGGFLISFIPAAFFVGWFNNPKTDTTGLKLVKGILGGTGIILILGYMRLLKFLDWDIAFTKGILPFIPGALFKGLIAFLLLNMINKLLQLRTQE